MGRGEERRWGEKKGDGSGITEDWICGKRKGDGIFFEDGMVSIAGIAGVEGCGKGGGGGL